MYNLWWKAGQTDLANLRVETVDILHFVVSKLVVESYAQSKINSIETVVEVLEATYAHPITGLNWVAYFKAISLHTLTGENAKLLQHLFGVFAKLEMDQVAIHHAYLTKNLLNHYRQARGYKDPNGDYLKLIGGREDNVVFGEIIAQLEQNLSLSQIKTQSFAQMDQVVADCRNRL
ncbi:dUTP diphosphatase [Thiomicrospira microaerophila]|uniref:dUTP diphosphatase n=1 Tax=Thiomicrospira microaerophila TaxID=406020 RepID=UPI0005CA1C19|nr:dUTP diphosphatase [Thiomicrospira microaerophila]